MKTTDDLYINGRKIRFLRGTHNEIGEWLFKDQDYKISVCTKYIESRDWSMDTELSISVIKNDKTIGYQTIPMEASQDRVLGVISKIISSYNQQTKTLESWADEQSQKDYLF
jgi:hypothetical protein